MSDAMTKWESRGRRLATATAAGNVFVIDEPGSGSGAGSGAGSRGASGRDPILVLHGFPTCSYDWAPVLDVLTDHGRTVLLDLPGYGLSDKPDRAYSLFDQADTVEAVAGELGLTSVVLVSHDMGDSVGGELLARDLDGELGFSVSGRVVTNGSIYLELAQLTDGQKLLESLPDAALAEDAGLGADGLVAALRATLAPGSTGADAELATSAEMIVRAGGNRLLPRLIRYLSQRREHETRWTGAIEAHPAPLAILWGELDPIAVYPMAERLHAARPDSLLTRLDGLGHYPMLEDPARFGAALTDAFRFLADS
ncbi:MAG TPA: alpha/beta hydrolase [Acidimicrobiia bacterium]|nr:alpha/beta hydrolase [Acidimicrobiia bacterium]